MNAHPDLAEVARSARLVDDITIEWKGRRAALPRGRQLPGTSGRDPVVGSLMDFLYERYYTRPEPMGMTYSDPTLQDEFVATLAAAARATTATMLPEAQNGFVYFVGPRGRAAAPRVRFYFAICAQGAAPLVDTIVQSLDREGVPFLLKVVKNPQAYLRADAAVLYVPAERSATVEALAVRAWPALSPWLRPHPPRFTREIAPGIATARDPATLSFGQHCCLAAAEGLVAAARGENDETSRLLEVTRAFRAEGIDPGAPYAEVAA